MLSNLSYYVLFISLIHIERNVEHIIGIYYKKQLTILYKSYVSYYKYQALHIVLRVKFYTDLS